ncbi:MAG: hypothetical protein GXO30_01415, partial [Epsilonproteobacteria bacterium]|nr:hypothetical protein [Campylobacterota bacterium]
FEAIFGTKNQKLVKSLTKEHEKIVVLAHKIIADYSHDDAKTLKKHLIELRTVAINHLMTEDIEFYRLLKDKERLNEDIKNNVHTFTDSFHDTKVVLRDFLRKYAKDGASYDKEFFTTFNTIVDVLGKRIEFEEDNLYKLLQK